MVILCLQHVDFEGPGGILDWAWERGFEVRCLEVSGVEEFPRRDSFDVLVVMGGPMGTYEEERLPWLVSEKKFIRECIEEGKLVLGICLGAQLIAAALGARVYAGEEKEIGWFPIKLTDEGKKCGLFDGIAPGFCPLHWHGDTFDLPINCTLLASSGAYKNQAFSFGSNVVALQFHLEVRPQDAALMVEHCAGELVVGRYIQGGAEIVAAEQRFLASNSALENFLQRWLKT